MKIDNITSSKLIIFNPFNYLKKLVKKKKYVAWEITVIFWLWVMMLDIFKDSDKLQPVTLHKRCYPRC